MKDEVTEFCRANQIRMKDFTRYQTRLTLRRHTANIVSVDIYWTNRRFHIITHPSPDMVQKRGDITDVNIFLESIFSNQ